jgi:hypothetical protein
MQRALYPPMYGERGPAELADESIVASHALIPEAQLPCLCDVRRPDVAPIFRSSGGQHEMIATMVSVTNRCRY